jgi:hypothetical protein
LIGGICGLIGWIWIVILAFQNGDTGWGIISLICGIAALIYGVQHFDEAKVPLGLLALGIISRITYRVLMTTSM